MSFLSNIFGSKDKPAEIRGFVTDSDSTLIDYKVKQIKSLKDSNMQESEIENLNRKYPYRYFIFLAAGNIFDRSKKYEKALFYYGEAIKFAKQESEGDIAYFNLGETYLKMKKFQDAIRTFHTAIELNKLNLICNYGLGDVYMKLADYPKARDYYLKFYAINRNKDAAFSDHIVANNLGYIESRLKNIKMACKYFSEAITINPEYSEAYFNLSQLYKQTKQYDLLKKLLEVGCKKFPGDYHLLSAYANLRMIFRDDYSIDETKGYASNAYKINPDDIETRIIYASIFIDDIAEGFESNRLKRDKTSFTNIIEMIRIHEKTLLMDIDNTDEKKIHLSLALGYILLGIKEKYEYHQALGGK